MSEGAIVVDVVITGIILAVLMIIIIEIMLGRI